jgi:AcrR family transcriptional regulator
MPKSTFYKLCDDKKRRIFSAALQEFSTRRFSDASINQIIKNAGIPKGSFYQYFNDKEDIYVYVLKVISDEKKELLRYVKITNSDMDVFDMIVHETKESLELNKVKPGYAEIGMQMELDNSEFITKIRKLSAEKYVKMLECDKENGLIKPDVDSELVVNMLFTFVINEYYRTGLDEERYLKGLNDVIKIIREGIAMATE